MINPSNSTFLLRAAVALILLTHSLPSIFTGDINNFGNMYLNQVGFARAVQPRKRKALAGESHGQLGMWLSALPFSEQGIVWSR